MRFQPRAGWKPRALILTALWLSVCCGKPWALEIHVPDDYPSITQGLQHAWSGDSVVVECGTYVESAMLVRSGVTLRSATGSPNCVVIDGGQNGSILRCWNAPLRARIEGITFMHGGAYNDADGGGCNIQSAQVGIHSCRFISNYAGSQGGGIYAVDSDVLVDNCEFSDNRATESEVGAGEGGAVYCGGTTLEVIYSTFTENVGHHGGGGGRGGAIFATSSQVAISDSEFYGNYSDNNLGGGGGAVYASGAELLVDGSRFEANWTYGIGGAISQSGLNCTITKTVFQENSSGYGADGSSIAAGGDELLIVTSQFVRASATPSLGCEVLASASTALRVEQSTFVSTGVAQSTSYLRGGEDPQIVDCLLVLGEGLTAYSCGIAAPSFHCCDIYSPFGDAWVDCYADQLGVNGNIEADPQFCGIPGSGNYYLQSDSPCAPNNNGCGELIGALPVNCDAVSTAETSISAIKALY